MVIAGKRTDPRAERAHQAALDAAAGLFLEEGVAAVTIDAVAARSGVAKTTIYRRWANRDDLLLDVFRRFALGIEPPPADLPPAERLRSLARQLAGRFADPQWQVALPALLGAVRHKQELAGLADRLDAHQHRHVRAALEDAAAVGALPGTDIGEALLRLVGPLLMAALMRPDLLTEGFADRLVDALLVDALSEDSALTAVAQNVRSPASAVDARG